MTIHSLLPATEYDVFCFSASSINAKTLVSKAADTKVTTATECCKTMAVDLATNYLAPDGSGDLNAMEIKMPSPPVAPLVVSLTGTVQVGYDGRRLQDSIQDFVVFSGELEFSDRRFGSVTMPLTRPSQLPELTNITLLSDEITIRFNVTGEGR